MLNLTVGEALERQHELAAFWHSPLGQQFGSGWVASRQRDNYTTHFYATEESHLLLRCPVYLVSADMQAVALHAAESMPDEQLEDNDLPSAEGLVILERALHMPDVHRKTVSIAAYTWQRTQGDVEYVRGEKTRGVLLVLNYYSDRDDVIDEYLAETRDALASDNRWPKYILLGQNFIPLGMPSIPQLNRDRKPEDNLLIDKFPRALWALMRQRIHETTEQRAERHVRRRLEREGSPLAQRLVRVVNLRKVVHDVQPGGGGAPVQWQQRWIVSGHWRNVWHASIQQHRLQWIAPFVKGPEDKPLVIKKTVGKLVR